MTVDLIVPFLLGFVVGVLITGITWEYITAKEWEEFRRLRDKLLRENLKNQCRNLK